MSILPSDTPRLPKWPFLVGDAALLGVALLIALRSPQPFPATVILTIAGCVALAALLGSIPFLSDYAARQDEALDERQRSLEALTRTLADAAEQISIAANGLQELNELAQKQLHQAQALPKQLAEQMHDHDRQLNEAAMKENAALRGQLETLRAAGIADLKSTAERLAQTAATLTKHEATVAKQLDAAQSSMAKLPGVMDRARNEAVQALDKARSAAVEQLVAAGNSLKTTPAAPPVAAAPSTPALEPTPEPDPTPPPPDKAPVATPEADTQDTAESPASAVTLVEDESTDAVDAPEAATESPEPKPTRKPRTPKKPKSADEAALALDLPPAGDASTASEPDAEADEPTSALTTDGATRVLVTAYIGIGNRLFIRGEGPGLSPDKGLPLQFVSIGKWRWESNDAAAPVRFRLFKNDSIECATLGEVVVEPGHQTEVTARF